MPDILIRGMEMPEGCLSCNLRATSGVDEWMCMVNRMRFPSWENGWHGDKYRHVDCPIHELPEHGGLVDLDERVTKQVYDDYNKEWGMKTKTVRQWLNIDVADMPVIVPSNKEEKTK